MITSCYNMKNRENISFGRNIMKFYEIGVKYLKGINGHNLLLMQWGIIGG